MRQLHLLIVLACLQIFFISCHKIDHIGTAGGAIPPAKTYIKYSIQGRVTDQKGTPIEGATISSSGITDVTDVSGYFILTNVNSSDQNAVITVEKSGYFKVSRSFVPQAGNINSVYVTLLIRNDYQTVDANAGGLVTFGSGVQLEFPSKAFITSNGLSYSGGAVIIYATYLNPADTNFLTELNGDLRATDSLGKPQLLQSFGMANVELETTNGQPLQIAPNMRVKLTAPIQVTQQSAAPTSIPLWYWSDSSGFWKQEGIAARNGNAYSGYVTHFTEWNFDIPYGYTSVKAKFVTAAGNAVSYRRLVVTVSNPVIQYNFYECRSTDSGKINALVPVNTNGVSIALLDDCGQVLYTQTLPALVAPLNLGTVVVTNAPNTLTIKGKALNCGGSPVTNGRVFIAIAHRQEIAKINADGTFILQTLGCSSTNQFTLYAINDSTNEQNTPEVFSFANQDSINVGNVIICNNIDNEFIQIIRNTDTFNYRFPEVRQLFGAVSQPSAGIDSARINIYALTNASIFYSGITLSHVPVAFSAPGSMYITVVNISGADSIPSYDPVYGAPRPVMNITEYGDVGQFIAGNYTGLLNRFGYLLYYNFKISFRVKRTQ